MRGKVKSLVFDFSRVLLFPKDIEYEGMLNSLHAENSTKSNYRFFDYFELNEKLLDYLEKIKEKFDLYIFTTGTIQNAPEVREGIDPIFKRIFAAGEMGVSKKKPETYLRIAKEIRRELSEILFVDDSKGNIEAAENAGLETFLYESNDELIEELESNFLL